MARSTHAYTAWIPGFVAGGLLGLLLWQREQSKEGSTDIDLPPLTEEQKAALASTAQALATRGKGILAADESTPTVRIGLGLVRVVWDARTGVHKHTDWHMPHHAATYAFLNNMCLAHTPADAVCLGWGSWSN